MKLDKTLRERRRINRLLDFLKRDDLTGEQMERIGRRLQKSGRRALSPLVRKLWREQSGTAIYRYTCMLDFFDTDGWMEQLIRITLKRQDIEEAGRSALLDVLHDYGIDVTAPPFAAMTGYGATSLDGFIDDCLNDGERGLARFMDWFLDAEDDVRDRMVRRLTDVGTPESVALLEILLSFERPEVVREAISALGRVKNGFALNVLSRAERRHEGNEVELIRRNIRRLSFVGVREPAELPRSFPVAVSFHKTEAGPIDVYGSRTLWFSWRLEDGGFASVLLLLSDNDGLINALSYRMKDEKEHDGVLREAAHGECLEKVSAGYALSILRDALHRNREQGFYLPPDFYVDMRLFKPDTIRPEAYIPRFSLVHLDGIVSRIPEFVASSNELLDDPSMEGWLLSEPQIYDVAERFIALEAVEIENDDTTGMEAELCRFCQDVINPRRADMIKRLLLAADYMQEIGRDTVTVQHTLATALSLVGGFLPECRHPFIRRLALDSIEMARQALAEGYDPRLEEGYDDHED